MKLQGIGPGIGMALVILCLPAGLQAVMAPTEDGFWYYEIGGARPISRPANPSVVSVTLGGSAQLGLGYSCAQFDPVAAVTNTLNEIGAGADRMMGAMTNAATAALAALPALILQRANPGLYDLFQNALIKAEETLSLATKSCQQMETEITQDKNPYADLIVLSKGNDWKREMGIGEGVRPERERQHEKDEKATPDRGRQGPEASTMTPEREIEPTLSRDKAPEPEPPARGKRVEMDLGL